MADLADDQRGTEGNNARVVGLQICEASRAPMKIQNRLRANVNYGFVGDRHAKEHGKRQILILDKEILDRFDLPVGALRENITVENINAQQLEKGTRIGLGSEVVLEITDDCPPCNRMDEIREGLQGQLVGQRGVLARVVEGGTVKTGEPIRLIDQSA